MKHLLFPTITLSLLFTLPSLNRAEESGGPAHWLEDMDAFAKRDAETAPPKGALLFTGSSTIRLWDLKTFWPGATTINNGFGGSTYPDVIAHFDRLIPPYDARAVIIYSGDNDIKKGHSAAEVIANVKALYALIVAAKPGVPVIFIGIKPSASRWKLWPVMKEVNEAMAAFEGSLENFYYADVAAVMLPEGDEAPGPEWFKKDGLHLSLEGYAKWATVVNETLKKVPAPK